MSDKENAYWRANIRLMLALLLVWFLVSFGCGILLLDFLNQYHLFGFKLGFWFSQQGSIFVFVALIFVYAWRMNHLDKIFGVEEEIPGEAGDLSGSAGQIDHADPTKREG